MTKNEAERLVKEIEDLQLENQNNSLLFKRLKNETEAKILKNDSAIEVRLHLLREFSQEHKELFTGEKDKKIKLKNGELILYGSQLSPLIRNAKIAAEALAALGMNHFLKQVVDKSAILANPGAVKHIEGIDVVRIKRFGVKPKQGKLVSKIIRREKVEP